MIQQQTILNADNTGAKRIIKSKSWAVLSQIRQYR